MLALLSLADLYGKQLKNHDAAVESHKKALLIDPANGRALAAIPRMPALVAPVGLALGWLYYLIFARRERRRLKLLNQPFPEVFRETLLQRVPLYSQLTELERRRFEGEVAVCLLYTSRCV